MIRQSLRDNHTELRRDIPEKANLHILHLVLTRANYLKKLTAKKNIRTIIRNNFIVKGSWLLTRSRSHWYDLHCITIYFILQQISFLIITHSLTEYTWGTLHSYDQFETFTGRTTFTLQWLVSIIYFCLYTSSHTRPLIVYAKLATWRMRVAAKNKDK